MPLPCQVWCPWQQAGAALVVAPVLRPVQRLDAASEGIVQALYCVGSPDLGTYRRRRGGPCHCWDAVAPHLSLETPQAWSLMIEGFLALHAKQEMVPLPHWILHSTAG